jgi:hypothetical protein
MVSLLEVALSGYCIFTVDVVYLMEIRRFSLKASWLGLTMIIFIGTKELTYSSTLFLWFLSDLLNSCITL